MKIKNLYFSHDRRTLEDIKIMKLMKKHEALGYGVFWGVVEKLHDEPNMQLNDLIQTLYLKNFASEEKIKEIINDCISIELFYMKDEILKSKRVDRNIEKMENCRKANSNGGKIAQENKRKEKEEKQ